METFSFTRVDEFPPAAAADRKLIELRGTRSGLYIPLQVDGKIRQILAVVSSRGERSWPDRFIERLKMLGEVIVTAISHKAIAAERLRSESNLAEAQRIANLGSWEWDISGDQVTTSRQCDRIRASVSGNSTIRRGDPSARPGCGSTQGRAGHGPAVHQGHPRVPHLRPDGGVRFVRDVYEFVLGADGAPAR